MGHASEGKSAKRMEVMKPSVGRALEFMFNSLTSQGVALGIISSRLCTPVRFRARDAPHWGPFEAPHPRQHKNAEVQLGSFKKQRDVTSINKISLDVIIQRGEHTA